MRNILVSRFSGVLSAYGLSAADVVCEKQEACAAEYGEDGDGPAEVSVDSGFVMGFGMRGFQRLVRCGLRSC